MPLRRMPLTLSECSSLEHLSTVVTALLSGKQATQAAEDVLAARASAHAHELNEIRRELSSAREDTKRFSSVASSPLLHILERSRL